MSPACSPRKMATLSARRNDWESRAARFIRRSSAETCPDSRNQHPRIRQIARAQTRPHRANRPPRPISRFSKTCAPMAAALHCGLVMTAPRMLVVDDEESILFAISDFFSLRGFIVDCAREVEEAWACLSGNHYGVVIADLRLTGIYGAEGLELVSYIREKSATTRVLLLT